MLKKRNKIQLVHYILLSIIGILFITPLIWMVFSSVDIHATQSIHVPRKISLSNFKTIIFDKEIRHSFWIGLTLSTVQSLIVVFISMLAAYPLSRYHLPGKKQFLLGILFLTSLPITAAIIPVFQVFLFFKIQNSLISTTIFMISVSLPYSIWMMKNFMDSVPVSLEESAWVDGASIMTGIRRIIVPLMLPGLCTIGIFTFTGSWGNFFVPFILISTPEKLPASVTIFQFFGSNGLVNYGQLAAFSILYTIPVIFLYIVAQRFMSNGFSLGGANK
ncbi:MULTISPECIES: carbohydrate ABC transporter permease [Enterococcus]|uniref:carbohydrate ABC transporter permease n=1 Tax=Enterococcus TaxID=1350 RepID=UPI0001F0D2E5|nr:carbohydrate ABC transporter permease [Enterococcus faecalis]EFT95519.1 ABC transporter, permease protein [Enterococcus faecalis TX0012]